MPHSPIANILFKYPVTAISPIHSLISGSDPCALLLLDEPTAACDAEACALVEKAVVASGLTLMIITHDSKQAERLSHKRLVMTTV
jgi:ABC-type uncharacterized transport system ATPase component